MFIPEEDKIESEVNTENVDDVINIINNYKENYVPKEELLKEKEDKKKLLKALANGEKISNENNKPVESIESLKRKLRDENTLSADYIQALLDLRDRKIQEGEPDPALPIGKNLLPTESDVEATNRVASVLRECLDLSGGDSRKFTRELTDRIVEDVGLPPRKF